MRGWRDGGGSAATDMPYGGQVDGVHAMMYASDDDDDDDE